MPESSWKGKLVNWLEANRGFVVLFFCLPASFAFDLILTTINTLRRRFLGGREKHDERVKEVQRRVRRWGAAKEEGRESKFMCTARPNWLSLSTTFFRKDLCHRIPVHMYDILEINEQQLWIRVEPMVTVGEVTRHLIPRGFTLEVTLEIADATLGGLAMGTGMTTHSHKAGLYHETILSYEVVLADGSLATASPHENQDLFKALPWSHGSLGFLVALTIRLIPVKPYIKMDYIPVKGQRKYCNLIRELSGSKDKTAEVADYVEATIYSRDEAVVMVGHHSDYDAAYPVNHVTRWYKPWFYKYTESFLKSGRHTELIPLREYLLRHNRAIFWVVESMIPFGNQPLFRLLFGWLLPPKPAFLKFTTTPGIRAMTFAKQVFQDIVLPIGELERQVEVAERLFDAFPLLVYPCRVYDRGAASGQLRPPPRRYLVPGTDYAMYNDLGVYGVPGPVRRKAPYDPVAAMRSMEKFTRDVGGFSFLYADIFMTRQEFEQMFDLQLYERVRRKYGAEGAFPHLYDKVRPEIDVFQIGRKYATKK